MFANTQAGGIDSAFPDVLLTPPAQAPVPYANAAQGAMGTPPVPNVFLVSAPAHNLGTKVPLSDGNNAGVAGVSSGTVGGASRPVTGANTVLFSGMPVTRLTSQNKQNTNNASGTRVSPSQTKVLILAP